MPTVHILYGFSEGPRKATRFLQALATAGFTIAQDAQQADVIVAHSGGCFIVPPTHAGQKVVLVGVPYSASRQGFSAWRRNSAAIFATTRQAGMAATVQYLWWSFVYICNMAANVRMLRGFLNHNIWQLQGNVVLVHNQRDFYSPPEDLPFVAKPKHVLLPGHHDDIWLHPQRYLSVLQ